MVAIRVLVVDDHPVVRDGLGAIFESEDEFVVVGKAKDGAEAIAQVEQVRPDVVLLDLRMPGIDGVAAMRRMLRESPGVKVLVLTTYDTEEDIFQAIEAGAVGYMLKDASWEEIFEAVRAAHRGDSLIHPRVASRLLGRFAQLSRQAAPTYGLSDRELEVLRLIAKGASNKMIAGSLHISESTAKNHVANVFRKLDVSDRTEAVTLALQKGIIGL